MGVMPYLDTMSVIMMCDLTLSEEPSIPRAGVVAGQRGKMIITEPGWLLSADNERGWARLAYVHPGDSGQSTDEPDAWSYSAQSLVLLACVSLLQRAGLHTDRYIDDGGRPYVRVRANAQDEQVPDDGREHTPTLVHFNGRHSIPAEVCWDCSNEVKGLWVPVTHCPKAAAQMTDEWGSLYAAVVIKDKELD